MNYFAYTESGGHVPFLNLKLLPVWHGRQTGSLPSTRLTDTKQDFMSLSRVPIIWSCHLDPMLISYLRSLIVI